MNLRQLEVFVAVAEEQSFSRAADRMHVVQSAVSASVRSLERELGATLFRRTGRGAELADAGQALLPEARSTLVAAQAARDAVADVQAGVRGSVMLGIMQSMRAPAPSPGRLLASFRTSHPAVQVLARHGGGSADMAGQVASGLLDLAFVSLQQQSPGVDLRELAAVPMQFVCHEQHPLAGRGQLTFAELRDEQFAELPPRWGTRIVNDRSFAQAGVMRSVAYEINDTTALVEFVRSGLAAAVLPPSIVGDQTGLRLIPLTEPRSFFRVSLATPSGRPLSGAARALRDHVIAQTVGGGAIASS